MKLLRSFPALAVALVMLSIVGLCAAQRSVGLLLVAGTLAAMSWYVTEGPRGRILPRWVSHVLLVGVVLNVFRDLLQSPGDPMGVLGRFTVLLTLIKLYERRTSRDYAQLLTLSLALMVIGCMQSSDLLFGVVLLLYVALGLYVLLLHQLHGAYERSREARAAAMPTGYRLLPPLRPILGRNVGLHFRLVAVMIGLAGIALSVGVFVGVPRGIGADLLASFTGPSPNRTTGFTWEVNLNTGGRINRSTARVMSVQVLEGDRPIEFEDLLYLRGAVLDWYEGDGVWNMSIASTLSFPMTAGQYERLHLQGIEPSRTLTQRITLVRAMSGEAPLFSMFAPVGLSVDSSVNLRYDPARQTIRTVPSTKRLVGYTVRAQPQPSDSTLFALTGESIPYGPGGWFKDPDGRVTAKARALLRDAGLPESAPTMYDRGSNHHSNAWEWNRQAAQVFTDYLQSPVFYYTLDLSDVRLIDEDPIVNFLFNTHRGHCEYFASALTALCHSVGIPARLIAGYLAQQYDPETQQYHVLEGNAHAWVEVATGPHRWTMFDPSPEAGLPNLTDTGGTLAQAVRSAYTRFEGNWASNVVGFDDAAQGRLMDSVTQGWSKRLTSALESVKQFMQQVNMFFNVGVGGYIWMGIVAVALVIAIIALIKLMRRSVEIRRTLHLEHVRGAEYRRMLGQLGFYLDMLAALRRGGMAKPLWQPPRDFALSLQRVRPEPAALVREITDLFYEARYGRRTLDPASLRHARELVRELSRSLG